VDIEARHKTAAVTICASNFLGKALVLQQSYQNFHPGSDFYILIVDKKHSRLDTQGSDAHILWVEDLGIANFYQAAFKFDVIELSTNVKPTVLKLLLTHYDQVLFLDPDICVFSELVPVFDALTSCSIVVTPHTLTPVMDGKSPSELEFVRFGTFNLGFIGVSKCEESFKFLDWWSDRCLEYGYYEPQLGLSHDQRWVDLAPCFFPGLKLLRDPGLNVAFFNLHHRKLSKRDGTWFVNEAYPLRFFHFSSFSVSNPWAIAHKQSRFAPGSRPDLHELLEGYAERLKKTDGDGYSRETYTFDYFDDGMYVSPTARRFYTALESKFPPEENPFAHNSTFQRFALSQGLVRKNSKQAVRPTFRELGDFSKGARVIAFALRNILRLVGPNRYFLLMRYMAHISSIRNQEGLFPNVQSQQVLVKPPVSK
jgi:hypothetical protein